MVKRVTPPMNAAAPKSAKAPGSIQDQGLGGRKTPAGALHLPLDFKKKYTNLRQLKKEVCTAGIPKTSLFANSGKCGSILLLICNCGTLLRCLLWVIDLLWDHCISVICDVEHAWNYIFRVWRIWRPVIWPWTENPTKLKKLSHKAVMQHSIVSVLFQFHMEFANVTCWWGKNRVLQKRWS